MKILLILMAIDYLTGLSVAYINKKVNSSTGRKGFFKKAVTVLLCVAMRYFYPDGEMFLIGYYSINEMLSIIENAVELGIPFPEKIKKALERSRNENELE